MIELRLVKSEEIQIAMEIINAAKIHLKEQGIDQWQTGYPDYACIERDIIDQKGFFVVDEESILGYLCIDYDGESAYDNMQGTWNTSENYVVVHRMAFTEKSRGKGVSSVVFRLVEELSKRKGINSFRVDTDADNKKMQHILKKNGFSYCGTIWFDNSEKIAFDKTF
ncbi:GNAT family N-acetyltransferase [Youxingia wuxianensis]|uniref:GNAT family N-acetyltransferase n=1 Tax=Youxingia wuxianensis TaxID=2763678 RepID=A0A926ENL6_9FIRM|nr:GNAT family N-acetyltransferase [Youxingia wuxianensis]MBC8585248.1 GNAT family N-acetyltransferase [Youxingia wuxianensis]